MREKKLILRDGVVWKRKNGTDDCFLVFNKRDFYLYELPASGICVLELCNGQNTGQEIGKRLIEDLHFPNLGLNDIFEFLDDLLRMNLIVERND